MRVNYKSFPYDNPAVPDQRRIWRPILTIKIIHNHAQSKRFDAVVDTGSDYCLFDANIGASIGVRVTEGREGPLGGIIPGARGRVYYHNVKLVFGQDIVDIRAGFSWDLTANVLGHFGFFENFVVTLDGTVDLPWFDVRRIVRH